MQKFIHRLIVFVSVLVSPFVVFTLGAYIIINNSNYWKLPPKTDYIVLGHSHPECAFNDSLIVDFVNVSKSGESYFYTYLKAKRIIPNNRNLKAVFVEFGNNNVSSAMDCWTWDDIHIRQRFPLYSLLLNYSDLKFLMDKNSKAIFDCPTRSFIKEFAYTYLSSFITQKNFLSDTRFGGYLSLVYNKTESTNNILQKDEAISEINLKYLQKTIELCSENGVRIFLIRSPVHTDYTVQNDEIRFQKILESRFQNVEFIDLAFFPLQNNEYGDFGHLNHLGACKFSVWFNKLLMNDVLMEVDKQKIINSSIVQETDQGV